MRSGQRAWFVGLLVLVCSYAVLADDKPAEVEKPGPQKDTFRSKHRGFHVEEYEDEEWDEMRHERHHPSLHSHQQQFDQADANKDGVLSLDEYRAVFRKPLERMTQSEGIQSALEASDRMRGDIFGRLDKDKNGVLARGEWDTVFAKDEKRKSKSGSMHDDLMEEDGHQSARGVQERLRKDGRLLHLLGTEGERDKAFTEADQDKTKSLTLDELQTYMAKPHDEMEKEQHDKRLKRNDDAKTRHDQHGKERSRKSREEGGKGKARAHNPEISDKIDEHKKRMDQARSEFEKKFEERQKEIDERMTGARTRIRDLRKRQVERLFKSYDKDADGSVTLEEWHAALSKHQRPHRVNSSEQTRRNALHKESLGTGTSD